MWEEVIDTNLGSFFNVCQATIDGIRAHEFGRLVNVGSINGQVNYATAKSGIHGFTKA